MVIETRAGVPARVLDEGLQRLQTQIDEHSNQIGLINVKLDRMESNCGEFKATLSGLQTMMEERLPKPAEPNVNQASSSIRVQPSFGEQLPTTPPSTHRLPIGAEERNGMPMRPPNQDIRLQPNQTRVGVQMGEGMENGQNRPILGDFGDPIEERRNVGNNARFMPPFQGHFDAPYEEPWLGMRQGRQQGQQAQLEPILGDFGDPIEERRNVGNNARFMPPFQGHFDAPYEEPWLGMRQGRQQAQLEPILGDFGDPIEERRNVGNNARQQGQQGRQAQPQRHASQAREPRNAPWPQGDVVEPWYDHGGGKGNWGRARNYQGPQDRDPYGKNQDPLQRQQGRQAREPRAMELEFPRFKGGDPTSWMFRAIQYFEYYQVHDASKVMHASYHLDDDALIWFQSCEHDLGCWDNFARAIQLRFGPPSYDDPMELLIKLKHVNSIEEYKGLFESLSNRIRNLSSMHKLNCFMSGLKDEVRLAIKMQGPRTLGEAYALAKIQEQYLANVKRSTRPSCEANKDNWEQHSSQQVAAQFGPKVAAQIDPKVAECDPKVAAQIVPKVAAQIVPKVAAQIDPKVTAQLDPKVAVQFDPKVAAQLNPKVAAQMDPKVVDPKPTSAKPTMTVQKLTPKQVLERRRKGLCYNCDESWTMWHTCKAMKLYLIEEVQEEEGAYVTNDEEEEMVEWCEERRNTKEESINNDIQVPSRYWLIGRSPLMKKQLEDSSSIRPQQDHNLEDKVFRWEGQSKSKQHRPGFELGNFYLPAVLMTLGKSGSLRALVPWKEKFMVSALVMGAVCKWHLRRLDKAAIIEGTSSIGQQEQVNLGNLCPVEQVEDVKRFLTLIPMWTTFFVYSLVGATADTFFIQQTSNLYSKIPILAFFVLKSSIRFIIQLLFWSERARQQNVTRVRIGIGMVCSLLCCIAAWQVEVHRLEEIKRLGLSANSDKEIPMSNLWLLPQFSLLGLMEGFADEGLEEFFNNHVMTKSMRSYGLSFTDCILGFGNFFTLPIVLQIRSWFKDTINESHLDKYFLTLAILSSLFLCFYVFVAFMCTYKEAPPSTRSYFRWRTWPAGAATRRHYARLEDEMDDMQSPPHVVNLESVEELSLLTHSFNEDEELFLDVEPNSHQD
uniref:Ty3 transposon capsid-like protein domain-containing protein n=1 Tax=Fagus sylvatica TaxID=28930 RepID=A0A2N9FEV1_FAGSY